MFGSRTFLLSLVTLAFFLVAPLWLALATRWPISSDLLFYSVALKEFSAQFWGGEFYPRWLASVNGGYGAPIFLFYSPLTFYFLSFFQWLSPIDLHGFGRIVLGLQLALIAMGITCRHWLLRFFDVKRAEKGALFYVAFPYICILIYVCLPVGQIWALALYPFLLASAHDITEGKRMGYLKLSVGYGLLFFTHLLAAMTFAAVPLGYILVLSKYDKIKSTLYALFSSLWGMAFAAVYLIPAVANKNFVNTYAFISGNRDYQFNFFHPLTVYGILFILIPLLGIYIELPKTEKNKLFPLEIKFFLATIFGAFYMVLPISSPVWELLPPLRYLQFPYRFFIIMLPAITYICCIWLPKIRSKTIYYHVSLFTFLFASINCYFGAFTDKPDRYLVRFANTSVKETQSILDIINNKLITVPEYQTVWMQEAKVTSMNLRKLLLSKPQAFFTRGDGYVTVQDFASRHITLHAKVTSSNAHLSIRRFYFPGWQTNVGTLEPEDATISLVLPKGEHDVEITLPWFLGEKIGIIISLCAALFWVVAVTRYAKLKSN